MNTGRVHSVRGIRVTRALQILSESPPLSPATLRTLSFSRFLFFSLPSLHLLPVSRFLLSAEAGPPPPATSCFNRYSFDENEKRPAIRHRGTSTLGFSFGAASARRLLREARLKYHPATRAHVTPLVSLGKVNTILRGARTLRILLVVLRAEPRTRRRKFPIARSSFSRPVVSGDRSFDRKMTRY